MKDIKKFDRVRLEEHVKRIGFKDLKWCPADGSWWGENVGWILYARHKSYSGPYEDYIEPIVAEEVDERQNHLKYRWVRR